MEKINNFDELSTEEQNKVLLCRIPGYTVFEYPFIRENMTWGEFCEERNYYEEHYEDYKKGQYIPLWQQKLNQAP